VQISGNAMIGAQTACSLQLASSMSTSAVYCYNHEHCQAIATLAHHQATETEEKRETT
jgi:hypothetical protein